MRVEVPVAGGVAEAWLARPESADPRPGVVLFMDAFGLRPRIEEMAGRVASWGYVVLAPNVFHREGRAADLTPDPMPRTPEERGAFFDLAGPRMARLTPDLAREDFDAYAAYLTSKPGVHLPLGVVGYCMGARLAVRAAGSRPDLVAACGGFHGGGLATDAPDSPHLSIEHSHAAYSFGHADADPSMDPAAVARLGEALTAAGRPAVNEIFSGARHGYTMSDTPVFDEASCERHFRALEALFGEHLR